jgi:hypothetical protein
METSNHLTDGVDREYFSRAEAEALITLARRGSVRNFVCEAVHHTAGFVNRPS